MMAKVDKDMLLKWNHLNHELKRIKNEEMELRRAITDELLKGKPIGTHNMEIDGIPTKCVKKVTHKLDKPKLDQVWQDMTEDEQEAVSWTPSLSVSKFKALTDESESGLLRDCVTVVPAAPSLTIDLDALED